MCRGNAADREFAISVLHKPVRAGDDHCTDRIATLNVTVVINLDTVQRAFESERRRDAVEQSTLRSAFRKAAAEGLARCCENAVHQPFLVAAPGHREGNPPTADRQSLFDQFVLHEPMAEQNEGGLQAIVVELADERGQNLLDRELAIMAREVRPVSPVLSASEKEDLDTGLSARVMRRDDVRVDDPRNMDVLMPLYQR